MKLRAGRTELIVGILGLISVSSTYLSNPTFSYYIPLIFLFLIVIFGGILELTKYTNKKLYQLTSIIILALMWVFCYFWVSPGVDMIVYYVLIGLLTITIVIASIYVPKQWENEDN